MCQSLGWLEVDDSEQSAGIIPLLIGAIVIGMNVKLEIPSPEPQQSKQMKVTPTGRSV